MRIAWQWLALVAVLSPLLGCGGDARGTLSGKVTLDDQPLSQGTLIFSGSDSSQNALATIQSDGTYKADGVPLGDVRVAVSVAGTAAKLPPGGKLPPGIPADHPQAKMYAESGASGPSVPKEYADPASSGLTVKVEGGEQKYDIPLKSKK